VSGAVRCILARGKHHVAPVRKRPRAYLPRDVRRTAVSVNAHSGEVASESPLHTPAGSAR
jgi:hypothetical protein